MNWKHLNEQEQQRRTAELMNDVNVTELPPAKPVETLELAENSLKVLIKAGLEPGIRLLPLYTDMGLHPAEGKLAVADLVARAFVKVQRFPRKGRGGQPQALEPLPKGVEELAKRGITSPGRKIARGGWKHDVYARHLERWAKGQGFYYCFEKRYGKKYFDFVYEDGQGNLRGIEICLTGSVAWTAKQAIKGAEVQGLEQVVLACERADFLKAILGEIGKVDGLGLYKGRIVGKLLAEYLE